MSDYLIVGGGVIGMMMARELAIAGADVTLVDRLGCAEESSGREVVSYRRCTLGAIKMP